MPGTSADKLSKNLLDFGSSGCAVKYDIFWHFSSLQIQLTTNDHSCWLSLSNFALIAAVSATLTERSFSQGCDVWEKWSKILKVSISRKPLEKSQNKKEFFDWVKWQKHFPTRFDVMNFCSQEKLLKGLTPLKSPRNSSLSIPPVITKIWERWKFCWFFLDTKRMEDKNEYENTFVIWLGNATNNDLCNFFCEHFWR